MKSNKRPTVAAIYYPSWHSYPHMSAWKGDGWTEWELVKTTRPRFRGHHQPLKPVWGYFDESDPKWAAKEIDLAADHGIDVFLFDWYWYSGVKLMEEALERGFLRAPNRKRMKFALMWANHDWSDLMPAPFERASIPWLPSRHSPDDLDRMIDYCIEHYFHHPNYWRLDGLLFYSVFQPRALIEQLGGAAKTRRLLASTDRKLHARGLPSIHWNAMTWQPADAGLFKAAGFLTTTTYGINGTSLRGPRDGPTFPYSRALDAHRDYWMRFSKTPLPHMPVVTMGWDVTPRTQPEVKWPFTPSRGKSRQYPYLHVTVGNTPERFGRVCSAARDYLREIHTPYPAVFVNAWNEWTEGSYLLPEKRYGTGYLKAIRDAFGA